MTRIGTFAASQLVLQRNMDAQARAQDLNIQLASGKKSQTYDGVSTDVRRLESLEKDHAANSAFSRAIDRTALRLQEMESAVSDMQDIASRFRTVLLQADSGNNLDSSNVQEQAKQFLDQTVSLMNTKLEGRFLFGGSATNRQPVDLGDGGGGRLPFNDGTTGDIESGAYFKGNSDVLSVRADEGVTIDYGITADPREDTGFHDLIKALSRVADPRQSLGEEVENAIRDLSGAVLAFESGSTAITDPAATLVPAVATAGTLQLVDSGGATSTINYDPAVDSLEDVAARINDTNAADARVSFRNGAAHLQIFSNSGGTLNVTETGGGSLMGDLGLTQNGRIEPGAIQRLADTRADIGSTRDVLERTSNRLADAQVNIEDNISGIENVNVTEAVTQLSQEQTTLETSFAVTARLSRISLMNFLR
ncbi:flagellin [Ferruginivarius sediminum]|uniref:Flagellin C-terminal domain-containing protein n=1 Tax=Ferruginivarius sediminum TaxID=2661937 RepID=A0A369TE74_9PROT|nr:flagellin [Ferruginivarius sediminum]RDD63651.1 hypothetical protein DRB17_00240 [Ferruginivarius sediminum]